MDTRRDLSYDGFMPWGVVFLTLVGQGVQEERGKFRLSFFGREAGVEEFRLERFEDGHFVLFSKARFEIDLQGSKRPYWIDTALTLDRDWRPCLYAGYQKVGSEERLVRIEWKGGVAVVDRKKEVRTTAPFVLDTNVFAQYLPLVRRYGGGRRKVAAFSPATLREIEIEIEDRGEVVLEGSGRSVRAREYRMVLGTPGTATLHVDGSGRMVRAWNPMVSGLAELEGFAGLERAEEMSGVEEVEVEFLSGDVRLAGTLAGPKREGIFPSVVFLSDEGPHDREGNRRDGEEGSAWAGFRRAARRLAREGIVSLRYDERGCGRSGGDFETARWSDLLADARAAVAFLRRRKGAGPVGLVAHGQGGVAALTLAAGDDGIGAVFLLGCPSRPWPEVLLERLEDRWRREEWPEDRRAAFLARERAFFDKILHSREDFLEIDERPAFVAGLRELFRVDPLEEFRKVKGSVVFFHGSRDSEVKVGHAARWHEVRPGVELRIFEGLDHGFRSLDGRPGDLEGPALGPDEAFLKVLADRIRERLR